TSIPSASMIKVCLVSALVTLNCTGSPTFSTRGLGRKCGAIKASVTSMTLGERPGDGAACWVAGEEAVGARSLGGSSRPQAARKHATRPIATTPPPLGHMSVPEDHKGPAPPQRRQGLGRGGPPPKVGTAYRNGPRQFGGTISRAQHPGAARGASTTATLAQGG